MRVRFLKSDSDSFADHEALEMLLYYVIPRKNTNNIAHELIERFGSLAGVTSASVDELVLVDGIGESAAVLIKLIGMIVQRVAREETGVSKRFDSLDKIIEYGKSSFVGATQEMVYMMLLDNSFDLIDCSCIAIGSINEVRPILRNIIERVIVKRASSVVLLHNHPNGSPEPSENDIEFSYIVERELNLVGVKLLEHLVISGKESFSIIKNMGQAEKEKLL